MGDLLRPTLFESDRRRLHRDIRVDERAATHAGALHHGHVRKALRDELPMNCRARNRRVTPGAAARWDIDRIESIWSHTRGRFGVGGPWLFGGFSIADTMFAPVAMRFLTYGIQPQDAAGEWMQEILEHPAMRSWIAAAEREPEFIAADEKG